MKQKGRLTLDKAERERVAALLRATRKEVALSQERAAERSGLSRTQLSNLERGKVNVTLGVLVALARAYGCKASEILEWSEL